MNTKNKHYCQFTLCIFLALLMISGCYTTQSVTVEARFTKTQKPVAGTLTFMHPKIGWPSPPRFEPIVSNDGFYDIKLINNYIWGYLRPGEYDAMKPAYKFAIDLSNKQVFEWDEHSKSSWLLMDMPFNSTMENQAVCPRIEYRVIIP